MGVVWGLQAVERGLPTIFGRSRLFNPHPIVDIRTIPYSSVHFSGTARFTSMRMKVAITSTLLMVLASIVIPMAIGASRGIGLSDLADHNEARPFAESYYYEVIEGADHYYQTRRRFSETDRHPYGFEVYGRSPCQERLLTEQAPDDDWLISSALSFQRSVKLRGIFDDPGIDAIDALPSPIVGMLEGCRYTLVTAACDAWSRRRISHANDEKMGALKKERQEWIRQNESASCKVNDRFSAARS